MGENDQHAKHRLRRRLQAARARLAAEEVPLLSAAACARALDVPAFRTARHVVVYAPIGNEIDPSSLAAATLATGRALYYPRLRGSDLDFLRSAPSRLVAGARGTREPDSGEPLGPGSEHVCFFVPGLAFDRQGTRLGRGFGCYDRALARHPNAVRIGLAYDMQLVAVVPVDPWDVPMHAVVTETHVHVVDHPGGSPALKENRP
jgi:5-formyltetrahydrofolate cyclo-ligase